MTDLSPHILVVDDHREIRDAVTRYLEKNGMRATPARDAAEMDVAGMGLHDLLRRELFVFHFGAQDVEKLQLLQAGL